MKHILRICAASAVLFVVASGVNAQTATINSTGLGSNYSVTVTLTPQVVLPSTSNCPFGYNYNVRMGYTILVSGTIPGGSLYTLQGDLGCVSGGGGYFPLPKTGSASGTVNTNGNAWRNTSDCGTATPASLSCNSVALQIEGPGISNRTINMTMVPLPVELSSAKLVQDITTVTLNWTTVKETNNNFFQVEKSEDGINWSVCGTVKSQNNNSDIPQEYSFDYQMNAEEATNPGVMYFRLSQTDLNGVSAHLQTLSLVKKVQDQVIVASAENNIMVFAAAENHTIEIMSAEGTVIHRQTVAQSGWTSISTSAMTTGIFVVRVSSPDQPASVQKVLVP